MLDASCATGGWCKGHLRVGIPGEREAYGSQTMSTSQGKDADQSCRPRRWQILGFNSLPAAGDFVAASG